MSYWKGSHRARRSAREDIILLSALRIPILASREVYVTASKLAIESKEHVFDTLYHAVTLLTPDATLVTADERYYRKSKKLGAILLLCDFNADQTRTR